MNHIEMLAMLVIAHAVADYPLQGDFLARAKNRFAPVPGVPWYHALVAHGAIHAGAVWLITGSPWLGLAEFAIHVVTDDRKCAGRLTYNQDQIIHIVCKVIWAVIAGSSV